MLHSHLTRPLFKMGFLSLISCWFGVFRVVKDKGLAAEIDPQVLEMNAPSLDDEKFEVVQKTIKGSNSAPFDHSHFLVLEWRGNWKLEALLLDIPLWKQAFS